MWKDDMELIKDNSKVAISINIMSVGTHLGIDTIEIQTLIDITVI